jgi:hypothetical protein
LASAGNFAVVGDRAVHGPRSNSVLLLAVEKFRRCRRRHVRALDVAAKGGKAKKIVDGGRMKGQGGGGSRCC